MENIENVRSFIRSLDSSIEDLQIALHPVLTQSLEETIAKCKLPEEEVKAYNGYLYCLISILYSYLKTLGIDTDKHPIMKELTRIKESMKRFKDYEDSLKNEKVSEEKLKHSAKEFLQRTLGTTGGAAAPDSMKSPAISSAHFQGTHTKFADEEPETPAKSTSKPKGATPKSTAKPTPKSAPSGKVTKRKARK